MKKIILTMCIAMSIFILPACTSKTAQKTPPPDASEFTAEDGNEITLNLAFGKMQGTYIGELKDDLPHGQGKFISSNVDTHAWYYEGEFKEGHMDGYGKTVWQSGQTQEGTFIDDIWSPNVIEYYKFLATLPNSNYVMTEKAIETLTAHEQYFPVKAGKIAQDDVATDFSVEKIAKNPEKYGDTFILISNVELIKNNPFAVTENPNNLPDLRCTYMVLKDTDGNYYEMYYRGDLGNIETGAILSNVIALPIGSGPYKDSANNQSTAVILAGCEVTQ